MRVLLTRYLDLFPGFRNILGRDFDREVTWRHRLRDHTIDSLYSISYRCFIGTDTNLKFVTLTILELLALNAQKFTRSRDPDHAPFRNFVRIVIGGMRAKFEVRSSEGTVQSRGRKWSSKGDTWGIWLELTRRRCSSD